MRINDHSPVRPAEKGEYSRGLDIFREKLVRLKLIYGFLAIFADFKRWQG